jgi:organic radical activating enzyme
VTKECPLSCPGCYAYTANHLGDGLRSRRVSDFRGQELVERIFALVLQYRPLHVSLVGGEPLVRHREISALLPRLQALDIHTQVVTSAVRPIPDDWRRINNLNIAVSIDGLQPEHDERRTPATYERIQKHIQGHRVTAHCTVTRQMTRRLGYLREFVEFWSAKEEVRRVWMSLYTPQRGEVSSEVLTPQLRREVLDELSRLSDDLPKLDVPQGLVESYREPPRSPAECIFAKTTKPIAADLRTLVTPCQLGGDPDCSQCGCMASAGAQAVGRFRLPLVGLRLSEIFAVSYGLGRRLSSLRPAAPRESPLANTSGSVQAQ